MWALADGMPAPTEGETFDSYWRRMGVLDDTITMAHEGLPSRAAEVANERMAAYLARRMPRAFNRYVERMRQGVMR